MAHSTIMAKQGSSSHQLNVDPQWQLSKRCANSFPLLALCLFTALAGHSQPSGPPPRSSDEPAAQAGLIQSQPSWLSGPALKEFQSLEPIDSHTHIYQTDPAFIGMLERLHMHVLDILVVDDTTPFLKSIEPQKQDAIKFVASSMHHAQWCTTFDPYKFNDPNFPQEAIDALNRDFTHGAVAVKIWKNVGMEIKNTSGQYVMSDDPRLEPIYRDIAAHHKTLIAHLAEPDAAWANALVQQARSTYYRENPQWNMSTHPGAPTKESILWARDHLLEMNPGLRVVGAHLGSMEADVDQVAARFNRYPNFAVDTAGRVKDLMIQPREKVRDFILKYQDRILYGTDLNFFPGQSAQKEIPNWEDRYALEWRYFATDDSFDYRGHKVEGLNLPRSVLRKIYHDNAVRWIPGIYTNLH